jgi:hypothetical protein
VTKKPARVPADSPGLRKYKAKAKQVARHEMAVRFPVLTMMLKSYHIDLVRVAYSGGGDSGNMDDTTLCRKNSTPPADLKEVEGSDTGYSCPDGYTAVKIVDEAKSRDVLDRIEALCEARWGDNDVADWCNNEGGGGVISLDVLKGTLTADHHYNETVQHDANFAGFGDAKEGKPT